MLARDYASVYTKPDNTRNRSALLNLAASARTSATRCRCRGNVYWRAHQDAHLQRRHQRRLAGPGASTSPTPPSRRRWRPPATPAFRPRARTRPTRRSRTGAASPTPCCNDEPAEKCNGADQPHPHRTRPTTGFRASSTATRQAGRPARNQWLAGAALDVSRAHFTQASEFGYLNARPQRHRRGRLRRRRRPVAQVDGDALRHPGRPVGAHPDLRACSPPTRWRLAPRPHLTLSGRYNRTTVENRDAITPGGGAGLARRRPPLQPVQPGARA